MNIHNINIDTQAIAHGIYNIMTEEDKTILAFGMLPNPIFENLRKMLGEKYDQLAGVTYEQAMNAFDDLGDLGQDIIKEIKESYQTKRKEFIKEAEHEVALAMYNVAPMVV